MTVRCALFSIFSYLYTILLDSIVTTVSTLIELLAMREGTENFNPAQKSGRGSAMQYTESDGRGAKEGAALQARYD